MPVKNAAHLLVECLVQQGVEIIFGLPGAKIDAVFDALLDSPIKLVVCRHEQNAAFMAAAYGRLTNKPGVVLVTSGPGVSNLVTGLLTATTEGDPVVAIAGNVSREHSLFQTHQNLNSSKLLSNVTKSSVDILTVNNLSEAVENAFLIANAPRRGACFINIPQDILLEATSQKPIQYSTKLHYGVAPEKELQKAANLMNHAKQAVLLVGEEASRPENTRAIRNLLEKTKIATISTFQAAGVISRSLKTCYLSRVGLFKNRPGDVLLDAADVVLTIGYNPIEYDPETWNSNDKKIIHLDYLFPQIHLAYQPSCLLLGDIESNVQHLAALLHPNDTLSPLLKQLQQKLNDELLQGAKKTGDLIHPLHFIDALRKAIDDDALVLCDVGSVYMWMAYYFLSYAPRHLLFSNGQQTLGVALPWAIAACLVHPDKKIISISGDGGFLFSAAELETAVREKCNLIHFIWRDGSYNMVLEQEKLKYHRTHGVTIGHVNTVEFARAFGATGFELKKAEDFQAIFQKALHTKGPVLIDVPIDYSDNPSLFSNTDPHQGH